jgi:hypothetical protein
MRRRLLPLFALAALCGPAIATQDAPGGGAWADLELPAGFHLDLASGEVTSRRPPSLASGVLSYENGRLESTPPLAAWQRVRAERISTRVARGGGDPASEPKLLPGTEFLFDIGPEVWGYLRVLSADEDVLTLEYARTDDGRPILEREPAHVSIQSSGRAFALTWPALDEPPPTYRRAMFHLGIDPTNGGSGGHHVGYVENTYTLVCYKRPNTL